MWEKFFVGTKIMEASDLVQKLEQSNIEQLGVEQLGQLISQGYTSTPLMGSMDAEGGVFKSIQSEFGIEIENHLDIASVTPNNNTPGLG